MCPAAAVAAAEALAVELDERVVVAREAGHAQAELELGEAALARRARVEHDVRDRDAHVPARGIGKAMMDDGSNR